jgi:hypothetical protein
LVWDPALKKIHDDLCRKDLEAWRSQEFMIAEKGFGVMLAPGATLEDALKAQPDQRALLTEWMPPCKTSKAPMATLSDAEFNHRFK